MGADRNRILIADAQYLTGVALKTTLEERFEIAAVCSSYQELMQWLETGRADLMILDPVMLDRHISSCIEQLKSYVPVIMVITNEITQSDFHELNSSGIEHIVLKSADRDELFHAVGLALKEKRYYSEEVLQLIVERSARKKPSKEKGQLTYSEMEIVKLIAEGMTTKEIALKKHISFHTVMTHRKNIFRKTDVKSASELIMHAIRAGWIDNIEYYI